MPKKIKQEDTELYKKLLLGFSFGQLALGFLYFMLAAINLPTLAVLLGSSIVCMILVRAFWEDKKFIRILVRVVSLTFILGVLILVIVTGIMGLTSLGENASRLERDYVFQQVAVLLCAFFQAVLLGFCPALAMAYLRGHGWDIMALRILSIMELVLAVCTAIFTYRYDDAIYLFIDNLYYSIFFVNCTAVTTVLTFLVFPPFAKKKGLLAQPKKAVALPAEPEDSPEEPAAPVKPVFRDLGDEKPLPPEKKKRRPSAKDKLGRRKGE